MDNLEAIFNWLTALPPVALLGAMALLAAIENVFPPIPADVLVAFGGFLAARAGSSPWPAFICVWLGNISGALGMYFLGRKFGAQWIARKFRLKQESNVEARLRELHGKYGVAALFISRFLPGIRSVMPPIAGGLRIPLGTVALSIATASALFYGLITWLAFNAGANWEVLARSVKRLGLGTALGAGVLAILILVVVWWRRRGARGKPVV
jgi:membrane protein DedA with SNARE-associated domain